MSYYYHPRRFGDNYMKPVLVAGCVGAPVKPDIQYCSVDAGVTQLSIKNDFTYQVVGGSVTIHTAQTLVAFSPLMDSGSFTVQVGWTLKSYNNNSGVDKTANVAVGAYYYIYAGGSNCGIILYNRSFFAVDKYFGFWQNAYVGAYKSMGGIYFEYCTTSTL